MQKDVKDAMRHKVQESTLYIKRTQFLKFPHMGQVVRQTSIAVSDCLELFMDLIILVKPGYVRLRS